MQKVILDKMEYHERHDDQRFHEMNKELWTIKIRNATIDGRRRKLEKNNNGKED